jgi:hypothetical protein
MREARADADAKPKTEEVAQRAADWVDKVLSPAINAQVLQGYAKLLLRGTCWLSRGSRPGMPNGCWQPCCRQTVAEPLTIAPQGVHGWDVLRALDHIRARAPPSSLDARAAAAIEKRVRKVGRPASRPASRTIPAVTEVATVSPKSARNVCANGLLAMLTGGAQLLQDTPEGQWHRGAATRRPATHHLRLGVPGRDAHPRTLVRDPGSSSASAAA